MGSAEDVRRLREKLRLPELRVELWHGFIFVNLDPAAPPLAPSLAKLDGLWAGYDGASLVAVPPVESDKPQPWNWKVHVENFTDAYHPEYVHRGTHDFAPSVLRRRWRALHGDETGRQRHRAQRAAEAARWRHDA